VKLNELLAYKAASTSSTEWAARSKFPPFTYPYRSNGKGKVSLAVASAFLIAKNLESHLVVISVRHDEKKDEKSYEIWCGDMFLEGRLTSTDATDPVLIRCQAAAAGHPDKETLVLDMQSHSGIVTKSDTCDFWNQWISTPKQLCVHTQQVLAEFFTEDLGLEMAALLDVKMGLSSAMPVAGDSAGNSALARFMFRVPVLIEGDRGSGKTVEVHTFAKESGAHFVKIAGHEGVEASDLLGHYVPTTKGGLIWKDGGLSGAFRSASKGIKTLLLIDELLRIPQRQLSVLLTTLSDFDEHYECRTGRIVNIDEGVGEEEVLRCKVEDLAVAATTNVGAEYALDQIDPALAERWIILRKDTTIELLKQALDPIVKAKGFSPAVISMLIKFFNQAQEFKRGAQICRTPTTRTIVRAVKLAERESEVKDYLLHQKLLWVDRDLDGYPNKEQVELLTNCVNRIFTGSKA
jgi:hypothetical protein